MTPIVSIVGKSDSGKTTLIEKIVPELARRGYRVATIKHDVHGLAAAHSRKKPFPLASIVLISFNKVFRRTYFEQRIFLGVTIHQH